MMSKLWKKLVRPVMFRIDPERAHEIGIGALKFGFGGSGNPESREGFGKIERFGLKFVNPVGMAAGFDKNGVVVDQLAALGFGFVEVGTVTYKPQPGNPKPRLFRLPADHALINRMGFNNDGAAAVAERLKRVKRRCVVGVNIGKNKDVPVEEATEDYLRCFEVVHPVADYVAVNISSPNTPNLRELQRAERLDELIGPLQSKNVELGRKPLLVKIAPDLSESEIEAAVDVCLRASVDAMIATNTTISREGLQTVRPEGFGAGGLSGWPLTLRSTEVISSIHKYSQGRMPIIGVGGIFTAEDAFDKIAAGACLVQAYSGFVYGGPTFAFDINAGIEAMLHERGFKCLADAVGSGRM